MWSIARPPDMKRLRRCFALASAVAGAATGAAPTGLDPFPPVPAAKRVVTVGLEDFARLPDSDQGIGGPVAARMMMLTDEPGTGRLFANDQNGPLYGVRYAGDVALYLQLDDPRWQLALDKGGRAKGFQSFAFHPGFAEPDGPGYGRFYTLIETRAAEPDPDFQADAALRDHDTVLLEWTARDPFAEAYDGDGPRELLRIGQPHFAHNGGMLAFGPAAAPGDADYGLLYVGIGDGGRGSDPQRLARDRGSVFGKILRIDPLGSDSGNGRYGIPAGNPFADDRDDATLAEVYALGFRHPHRMAWDPETGDMLAVDTGQNVVEEINVVVAGADYGWSDWEGSFRHDRDARPAEVVLDAPRSADDVAYPLAEYDQQDPVLVLNAVKREFAVSNPPASYATGLLVYREGPLEALRDRILFGDGPSGEVLFVPADDPPPAGWRPPDMGRVLFEHRGKITTLLTAIQETNAVQGRRRPTPRADLRFGSGPDGEVFLLNKFDGVIRRLRPPIEEMRTKMPAQRP